MRKGLLLLVLLWLVGAFSASAQDDDNPLLDMLARVPDSVAAREWLTYIDYDAVFNARPGAPSVKSWEEFEALNSTGGDERRLLTSALLSFQSGPTSHLRYIMQAGAMPKLVGFDLFEVERAIEFGQPPGNVTIFEGDFDADAIIAAHQARDYTQSDAGDFALLCPPDGCDTGTQMNLAARDPANPFGGDLGRSQPVLLGDGLVASSTDDQALLAIAETIAGEQDSIADQPDYRAAAEAVASVGTVLQTYFISPLDISSSPLLPFIDSPNFTEEQIEALRERLQEELSPLPQYTLVALAHTATENEQQAVVAVVYTNPKSAETAAEVLSERLTAYTSLVTNQPFWDLLTVRGVTSVETSIYESGSRPTVLITLRSPLPPAEVPEGSSTAEAIGLPYAILVRALIARDLGWLATEF